MARAWLNPPPKITMMSSLKRLTSLFESDFEIANVARVQLEQGGVVHQSPTLVAATGWQLTSGGGSLDVELHGVASAKIVPYEIFLEKAGEAIEFLTSDADVLAHRVATVSEGLLGEMPGIELDAIAGRLMKFPTSSSELFEWDWRAARRASLRYDNRRDTINSIIAIKRVHGKLLEKDGDAVDIDRIRIDTDINTIAEDTTPRLSPRDLRAFVRSSADWHKQIDRDLTGFLGLSGV